MEVKEVSKSKQYLDFDVLNAEISSDNVIAIFGLYRVCASTFPYRLHRSRVQKMFADLYADINHKNEVKHVFSESKK